MKKIVFIGVLFSLLLPLNSLAKTNLSSVRLKDLCRLVDARDNPLVGYGIVTGLAGTGDSRRSKVTLQSISNVLKNFGIIVPPRDINSRNVAAVMVTATLTPYSQEGDKLDVYISSVGDARSLLGGSLLVMELKGADNKTYALAQGPISVGGFYYDKNGNVIQKNHPNAGKITNGGVVERSVMTKLIDMDGRIRIALNDPDFTTANRIIDNINSNFSQTIAIGVHAGRISVKVPTNYLNNLIGFITKLENIRVRPDSIARIVINEKTGTIVAGGEVLISKVSIIHGDLHINIQTDYKVSQPQFLRQLGDGVQTVVTPDTQLKVTESKPKILSVEKQTTVADLVTALSRIKASSRDIVTILQAVRRAGGMHAEIIVE